MSPLVSPLAVVVRNQRINSILSSIRIAIANRSPITIAPGSIQYMKEKFNEGLKHGERSLQILAMGLCEDFYSTDHFKITLIVWGRCFDQRHPKIIKSYHRVQPEEVVSETYSDARAAWMHVPVCPICHKKSNAVASFHQFQNLSHHPSGLKRMLSRIKTTSNICYKVTDMAFDIDRMFHRDKIYNEYSQQVTDIYGLKLCFETIDEIMHARAYFDQHADIQIVEEKNYLGSLRKSSGYETFKMVVKKDFQLIEIQMQTHDMMERERKTQETSHQTYKERQLEDRRRLGPAYMNVYNALWTMLSPARDDPETFDAIELGLNLAKDFESE